MSDEQQAELTAEAITVEAKAGNGDEPEPLRVVVNPQKMTFGDLLAMDEGNMTAMQIARFISHVVVSPDLRDVPIERMEEIVNAIQAQMKAVASNGNLP